MKLIVGLGNIGKEYDGTRHNVGFFVLDHLAEEFSAEWHQQPKFKAITAALKLGGEKVILAKPTTYYNLSGEATRSLSDFYKIDAADVLIIHDELALPFGMLRTRLKGSDAGNNGVKNINAHLGETYARIRVGIANDQLTDRKAEHFVLESFTNKEKEQLATVAEHATRFVEDFIHEDKEFSHTSVTL